MAERGRQVVDQYYCFVGQTGRGPWMTLRLLVIVCWGQRRHQEFGWSGQTTTPCFIIILSSSSSSSSKSTVQGHEG